jgi:hypothetical protein
LVFRAANAYNLARLEKVTMNPFAVFLLAGSLAALSTASLFFKNEGARGLGRVFGGFSTIAFGAFFLMITYGSHQLAPDYGPVSALIVLMGVLTVAAGVRKFMRRNIGN